MAGCKKINLGVRSNNPEPVVLSLEGIYGGTLVEIPHSNGLILTRRDNQVLVRVKQTATGVLEVASAGINLPLIQG
jgi:hypothetical protein